MPIYNPDEGDKAPVEEQTVNVPATASVYNEDPSSGLAIVLDGAPWDIKRYYSQILGKEDSVKRLDMNLSPTLQQYMAVNDFVILATDPLTADNDEHRITTLNGGGRLYPALAPNVGDMFVAKISGNRWGLFTIVTAERDKYYAYTSWLVTYRLVDYMNDEYQRNLDRKTVDERWFDKDKPTRLGETGIDHKERYRISTKTMEMLHVLFDGFYDKDCETLILLDGSTKVYDSMVTKFLKKLLPFEMLRALPTLKTYTIDTENHQRAFSSVWDCLMDGEKTHLRRMPKTVARLGSQSFFSPYLYTLISFSKVEDVLLPRYKTGLDNATGTTAEDNYVFGDGFYDGTLQNCSQFEILTYKALSGESFTAKEVIDLVEKTYELDDKDLFYRIPILLWLMLKLN